MALYSDWYITAANPSGGLYADMYANFGRAGVAANLLEAVAQREHAFAVVYLTADGQVHLVHRMERQRPNLAAPNALYSGRVVGIEGEISAAGANYVLVSDRLFAPVTAVDIPSGGDADAAVVANPNAGQVDVPAPADPTDTVVTRYGVVLPHPWVPDLLRLMEVGPVTPAEFWKAVAREVLTDQDTTISVDCTPLIEWARVAVAGGVGGINPLSLPVADAGPARLDQTLGVQRAAIHAADFALAPVAGAANPQPLVEPLVEAIVALGAAQRHDAAQSRLEREEKSVADAAAKASPLSLWGEKGVTRLLRLCQVPTVDELPPIYRQIVASGVKHCRATLEAAAQLPPELDEFSLQAIVEPTVSAELARNVALLKFLDDEWDVAGGLSIFAVAFANQADKSLVEAASALYDHQVMGTASLRVSDLKDVQKAQAIQLPDSWYLLHRTLSAHHRMIQILLGEDHPVPDGLRSLIETMEKLAFTKFEPSLKSARRCAEIMSSVQTYTWVWMEEQRNTRRRVRPEYSVLRRSFRFGEWLAGPLPPRIDALLRPDTGPRPVLGAPAGGAASLVTAPSEHRIKDVFNGQLAVRALLAVERPPRLPNGSVPCINYHVRGACKTDCPYGRDHRLHTDAETAVLVKYLKDTIPKIPPTSA